jgi:phage N-6-adenine-methyltransferase
MITTAKRIPACVRNPAISTDDWYTPRSIIDKLGRFDLDPANGYPGRYPTADRHYGPDDNGLAQQWFGRVWLNPPFSNAGPWALKMAAHGNGIMLVFCRSDALWFQNAMRAANLALLVAGRINFMRPGQENSRCPLGSVLLAYGSFNCDCLLSSGIAGLFVKS